MKHLDDVLLNEYLDDVLDASRRRHVDAHLAECTSCQAKLESLLVVFRLLPTLEDQPLPRDLKEVVLERMSPGPGLRLGRLAFAVQAGFVLGFLILLAKNLASQWMLWSARGFSLLATAGTTLKNGLLSAPSISLPRSLSDFFIPSGIIQNSLPFWPTLGIAVLLLFVVGNLSLIRRGFHPEKLEESKDEL